MSLDKNLIALSTLCIFLLGTNVAFSKTEETVLFKQVPIKNLQAHFCLKCNFPPGKLHIVQWEETPVWAKNDDLSSDFGIGKYTGLSQQDKTTLNERVINDGKVHSGVQVSGDAIGVYINSNDLPHGSPGEKFIITPVIKFDETPYTEIKKNRYFLVSFDLQVPTSGNFYGKSSSYVTSDLRFRYKKTKNFIYINTSIFQNNAPHPNDFIFFDKDTSTPVAFGPILNSKFSKAYDATARYQSKPWIGWKHFSYYVDYSNFAAAFQDIYRKYHNETHKKISSDWHLSDWHLNAEILFKGAQSDLGWSMKNLEIKSVHSD